MANQVICSNCGGSGFSSETQTIDRNTGGKPAGMGSLLGGLALGIVGVFLLIAGLVTMGEPATQGVPPWWQAVGLGALLTYWGLALVVPHARNKDRVGLITNRCNDCGRTWKQLADEQDGPGVAPLLEALHDENAEKRAAAVSALGIIGYLGFKEPLFEALEDEAEGVRRAAAMALGDLRLHSAIKPLLRMLAEEELTEWQGSAASHLAILGEPEVIPPIIDIFKSVGWRSQGMFTSALENIRNPRAVELLTQLDADTDENLEVRMAAKKALKAIAKQDAWEPLVEESEIPVLQFERAVHSTDETETAKKKPWTPAWAWVFAAACAIIPVLTLGGAIPGGIGGGGAFACVTLARNPTISIVFRIAGCFGIVILCWVLVFAIVGSFAMLAR